MSVPRPKGRSLSLASASRVPKDTTERPATIGTTDGGPGAQHYTAHFPKFRKRFDLLREANVLSARNHLDQLVKEHELQLVLPEGSVFCSKKVYLGNCDLCKEETAVALASNLSFLPDLKDGAPRKEL